MKTAISISDRIYRAAEAYARRMKKSRSQLYSEAMVEYLARHSPDAVTEAMNTVVQQIGEPSDPFVAAAARRTLERVEW
jgi:metal-responsive CopG/Arc/MetJ family transcriptional regulator